MADHTHRWVSDDGDTDVVRCADCAAMAVQPPLFTEEVTCLVS